MNWFERWIIQNVVQRLVRERRMRVIYEMVAKESKIQYYEDNSDTRYEFLKDHFNKGYH